MVVAIDSNTVVVVVFVCSCITGSTLLHVTFFLYLGCVRYVCGPGVLFVAILLLMYGRNLT